MFPRFSSNNDRYIKRSHGESIRNYFICNSFFCHFSNFYNLITYKFRIAYHFTTRHCAVGALILMIIYYCIPSQVIKKTVGGYAIIVTALHPWWAGANKSEKDKLVNFNQFSPTMVPQVYDKVTSFIKIWFSDSLGRASQLLATFVSRFPERPNASVSAGFVTFPVRNLFPFFKRYVKLIFSHLPNLRQGWWVVKAVSLRQQRCGLFFYNIIWSI